MQNAGIYRTAPGENLYRAAPSESMYRAVPSEGTNTSGPHGGYRTKTEQKQAIAAQKRREKEIRRRSLAVAEDAKRRHKEDVRRYKQQRASERAKRREVVKLWGKDELKRLLDARIELEEVFANQANDRFDLLAEKLAEPLVNSTDGDQSSSMTFNENGLPVPAPFKAKPSQCRAKLHNTRTQYKKYLEECRDARAAGEPEDNIRPFEFAAEMDKIFGEIPLDPPRSESTPRTGKPRGRPRRSDPVGLERRTNFSVPGFGSNDVTIDQSMDFGDSTGVGMFDFMGTSIDRPTSPASSDASSTSSTSSGADNGTAQTRPTAENGMGPPRGSLEEGLRRAYVSLTSGPSGSGGQRLSRSPTKNTPGDHRTPAVSIPTQSATERQNVGASFLESFFRHQTEQQERRFERERQEREERRAEREREREHERRRDLEERKLDRQEAAEERAANMQIFLAGLAEVMKS